MMGLGTRGQRDEVGEGKTGLGDYGLVLCGARGITRWQQTCGNSSAWSAWKEVEAT